jgi:hypothetical protein
MDKRSTVAMAAAGQRSIGDPLAVTELLAELRTACRDVASRARSVAVVSSAIAQYADDLPLRSGRAIAPDASVALLDADAESLAAFWLTLDAINFGSGWFPTLRKRDGRSGYFTIAAGVRDRFGAQGAWSAVQLSRIAPAEIASALGQDPGHELIGLFALSLNDLGAHVVDDHDGRFSGVLDAAGESAGQLVSILATWKCFRDVSLYGELEVPFLKRAQIAVADLSRVGLGRFDDLGRLTMFADNLVPHVLRVDGILSYDATLLERIERGELIEHGSPEEVEIRACALHAVELIVAKRGDVDAAEVDQLLWHRGQGARYKAIPRHRARCTAY